MGLVLARTGVRGVGELEVSTDPVGLKVFARISPRLSYAQDLAELMRTGVVDQMSFAFSIGNESFTNTTDEATGYQTDHFQIETVSALYDCTVCAQGAYPTTDAVLHSRALAAGRTLEVGRHRSIEPQAGAATAGTNVAPEGVGGNDALAVRRRRVELARISACQHFPDPEEHR
jgi:HK97 family phage prohead protease